MGQSSLIPAIKGRSMLLTRVERERIWRMERDVVVVRVRDILLEQLCTASLLAPTSSMHSEHVRQK